jgi:anti-anti-sigma regulatory factor
MASNFAIVIHTGSGRISLKLAGDFDATSAYELIHAIKKLLEPMANVCIDTNGLKRIHPFGLHVLGRSMRSLNGQSAKIVFKGKNASQLSNAPLTF